MAEVLGCSPKNGLSSWGYNPGLEPFLGLQPGARAILGATTRGSSHSWCVLGGVYMHEHTSVLGGGFVHEHTSVLGGVYVRDHTSVLGGVYVRDRTSVLGGVYVHEHTCSWWCVCARTHKCAWWCVCARTHLNVCLYIQAVYVINYSK